MWVDTGVVQILPVALSGWDAFAATAPQAAPPLTGATGSTDVITEYQAYTYDAPRNPMFKAVVNSCPAGESPTHLFTNTIYDKDSPPTTATAKASLGCSSSEVIGLNCNVGEYIHCSLSKMPTPKQTRASVCLPACLRVLVCACASLCGCVLASALATLFFGL